MEKYVKVSGGSKIYLRILGQGEALILLHGNGENSHYFDKQIRDFAKYFKVIAIDTRGHGKSDPIKDKLTFEDLSRDLLDILNFLKIDKANILGFSDGANIALVFAKNYPSRIKKLILNSPNKNVDQIKLLPRIFSFIFYYLLKIVSNLCKRLRNYFSVYSLIFDTIKIKDSDFKKIDFPVLIIAGAKDLIYIDTFYKIAKKIKKSKLSIIKGHGHKVAHTNPKEYNKIILDFLRRKAD